MPGVQVGDTMQVWLDYAGFQGRVGKVEKVDKRGIVHLRLGAGDLVRLNLQNRTARIHGVAGTRPLKYKIGKRTEEKKGTKKAKTSRFKRTTSV